MDGSEHSDRRPSETAWCRGDRIRSFQEIMFSANIATALGYAALLYISNNENGWSAANDAGYYFLRSAFKLNDVLRLRSISAVSTDRVAREFPNRWSQVGSEVSTLLAVFALAVLLLSMLRLIGGSRTYEVLLGRVGCATALFAMPAFALYVEKLKLNWASSGNAVGATAFWRSPTLDVLLGGILCLGLIVFIFRNRAISTWTLSTLLFLHYGFWVSVLWPKIEISVYSLFVPYTLLLVFPLSGVAWLLYFKRMPVQAGQTRERETTGMWTSVASIVAIAAVLIVWLPRRGTLSNPPLDINSLTIQMSRGPCFGSCPSYTITIQGNGLVEYVGARNVRVRGTQTAAVSRERAIEILHVLDRSQFAALEDRAFSWCFDTSSVGVSVFVDGKKKRVVSDGNCFGAKSGHQAQFVRAVDEIEKLVGSDRWVKCDGRCLDWTR
jgi:hypothetical protein